MNIYKSRIIAAVSVAAFALGTTGSALAKNGADNPPGDQKAPDDVGIHLKQNEVRGHADDAIAARARHRRHRHHRAMSSQRREAQPGDDKGVDTQPHFRRGVDDNGVDPQPHA